MAKHRYLALTVCIGAFAFLTMSAESCSESVEKADKAATQLEKATTNNPQINQQVNAIPLGSSIDEVKGQMGEPDNSQISKSEFGTLQFLYYGQWQLSFSDGVLDGKSKF